MGIEEAVNYRRISDAVATSGCVAVEQLETLKTEDFEAVVNLLPDASASSVPDERAIVEQQGVEYHYLPVDFGNPTAKDFSDFVQILDDLGDRKVLIHCAANYRVSAFYSLYAMKRLDWPKENAEALVGSLWNPAERPPWKEFMERIQGG
jgi:protein tyrosine phosphatase (PTP) superfamily phosphohydrolase (DUF442 family)